MTRRHSNAKLIERRSLLLAVMNRQEKPPAGVPGPKYKNRLERRLAESKRGKRKLKGPVFVTGEEP